MMGVCLPGRPVTFVGLIAPCRPAPADAAPEHLQIGARRTVFDQLVLFVGLARMLSLPRFDHVDLATAGSKRARVLAAHAKKDQFRDIPKIEPDAATVGPAVLADFVPNDV